MSPFCGAWILHQARQAGLAEGCSTAHSEEGLPCWCFQRLIGDLARQFPTTWRGTFWLFVDGVLLMPCQVGFWQIIFRGFILELGTYPNFTSVWIFEGLYS